MLWEKLTVTVTLSNLTGSADQSGGCLHLKDARLELSENLFTQLAIETSGFISKLLLASDASEADKVVEFLMA